MGMESSLLNVLDDVSACVELTHQYRMNEALMSLPNNITYQNKLHCGTEAVKNATIQANSQVRVHRWRHICTGDPPIRELNQCKYGRHNFSGVEANRIKLKVQSALLYNTLLTVSVVSDGSNLRYYWLRLYCLLLFSKCVLVLDVIITWLYLF